MVKPTDVRQVTFTLPESLLDEVDALAKHLCISRSELIRRALISYMEHERLYDRESTAFVLQPTREGPRIAEEVRVADPNVLLDKGSDLEDVTHTDLPTPREEGSHD